MVGIVTLLIKANLLLSVLYLVYVSLFRNDTYFVWRRIALLSFYAIVAMLVIALQINWVFFNPVAGTLDEGIATVWMQAIEVGTPAVQTMPDVKSVILIIWLFVAFLLALRFLWQLTSIAWLVWRSEVSLADGVKVRLTSIEGSPFSFFSWIKKKKKLLFA